MGAQGGGLKGRGGHGETGRGVEMWGGVGAVVWYFQAGGGRRWVEGNCEE